MKAYENASPILFFWDKDIRPRHYKTTILYTA